MGSDDDIAISLPQPPPPAPARREAAIGEALQRFDAGGEPAPATARPPTERGVPRRRIGSAQAAAFVAVALVALIGVPAAWMTLDQRQARVGDTVLASADSAAGTAGAGVLSARPAAPQLAAAAPPPGPAMAADVAPAVQASPPAEPPSLRAPAMKQARAGLAEAPPATIAMLPEADKALPGRTGGPAGFPVTARAAPAPAPPPPAAAAPVAPPAPVELADADASDSVVVTGQRVATRRARARGDGVRGDWNACTIDDPDRSLGTCRDLTGAGTQDRSERAAAHVADGLRRGWTGDFAGAVAEFDRAIGAAPRLASAYLNRGLAYRHLGDRDRAIADLDRAVRYAPDAARGYYNRSRLLRERGDMRRAGADERRALDLDASYEAVVR